MAAEEFVYTVPLTAFAALFRATDPALHGDLAETLRSEIHGDLARRRAAGRTISTVIGPEDAGLASAVVGGDIVITLTDGDGEATPFSGRRPVSPRTSVSSFRQVTVDENRWPGHGRGVAVSVNAVMSRAPRLARAYERASSELVARRQAVAS